MAFHEKTISSKTVFDGKVVRLELHDVELEDGHKAYREIVRHQGAIGVLARREDGCFVFVRQYRKPVEEELIEVVAGLLEPEEDHEEAARRELEEETGYHAVRMQSLGTIYATPGYVDETIELFYADVEPSGNGMTLDHDERVEVVILSGQEFEEAVKNNTIRDSKTLAAWTMYRTLVGEDPVP